MSGLPWKLVIFDNDGVMVDSEPLAEQAMSGALAAAGYPLTPEECGDLLRGTTLVATRRIIEERSGLSLPADFEDRYSSALYELMRTQLHPVPGVDLVLDRLDARGHCLLRGVLGEAGTGRVRPVDCRPAEPFRRALVGCGRRGPRQAGARPLLVGGRNRWRRRRQTAS